MNSSKVSVDTLKSLEPICSLSEQRLQELVTLCYVEHVSRNLDPFRMRPITGQTVYLIHGELAMTNPDGYSQVLVGGSDEARYPLGRHGAGFAGAKTITDVDLVRIDDDLLDILVTWDQLAIGEFEDRSEAKPSLADWSIMSGIFGISNLKYGAFSQLPPAHIEELLRRFKRLDVKSGEVIIHEGAEGDYYYVIESGRCRVERKVGGVSMLLAEIKSGDAFGEEALVSETKRNATVTAKEDSKILRLDRKDFNELLREPLLQRISMNEAMKKVAAGAQWVDVRYPSEYQYDRISSAMNIPLSEIRNAFGLLDKDREYILYCQSERRSSAAAFLLAQRGYRAYLLDGGLWGKGAERRSA